MEEQTITNQRLENEMELIERAKTDDQAFEILYNFYFPKIYGYLFKRVGNRQVTEDLTSIAFMKVFCNLGKYKHQGYTFGAWIYRIATNNLIDYYRKSGRRQEVDIEQVGEIESNNPSPGEVIQNAEESMFIKFVLKKLPERYSKVLHLKFFAEMSNQEIAQTLKISSNNAGVLIYRALKNFQKIYKKYEK